jgi:hypothetical protein
MWSDGRSVNKNLLLHLLTENELNHREIAECVGCTAERVRQLELKLLGRTGHDAQRERRERKLQANFERNEFVKAAKRRGLIVEPSERVRGWHERQLYINGKLCLLRRAYENVGYEGWYTAIRNPWQRAEICVMELGQGRFLIIPMKKMPRSRTMFSLDDADSSKRVCKWPHYWRKYLNNWAAFDQEKGRRGKPPDPPPAGNQRPSRTR